MDKKVVNKNNSNNLLIILVVVLTFMVGSLGTYVLMINLNNKDNNQTQTDNNNESEKTDNEKEESDSVESYPAGSINTVDYIYGDFTNNPGSMGITPVLISGKYVEFEVNGSIFGNVISSMTQTANQGNFKFSHTASAEIKSAFVGGFGQAVSGNEFIFLLMKDGTVQYKYIFDAHYDSVGKKYFTTDIKPNASLTGFKKLDGVKNGNRFVNASKALPQHTASGTVLLYVDDDSFYDLEPFFMK